MCTSNVTGQEKNPATYEHDLVELELDADFLKENIGLIDFISCKP